MVEVTADHLRSMSLPQLVDLAARLGLEVRGLEDRRSAVYTKLIQSAYSVE